jgi:ribonucleoside-diphosphate reductase alpha chain/ribonucleoside-triphosphate reductase
VKPPFTELGEFVYYRTYSRWLDDEGRRENWDETCRRAVEFNVGLEVKHLEAQGIEITEEKFEALRKEAETLYDNMFNLRQFLSGRTLWTGGTAVADKFPLSNFNCSFLVLDSFEDFSELFYLLMVGTGVGFRALPDDISKFPAYRTDVELNNLPYVRRKKEHRLEDTQISIGIPQAVLHVGDSKEGWVNAIRWYFKILTDEQYKLVKEIQVVYDSVRPKGERLKTFGGTASGHESLKNMFTKIDSVMKRAGGKLSPIDAMDIANIIGENVVVGGVRRTSEICLFDPEDNDMVGAKSNIYYQDADGNWKTNTELLHRRMSNNSLYFTEKPSRDRLATIMQAIRYTGEPAFINAEAASKRRERFNGVNPCGEVLLDDKQCCNLTTNNVMAFIGEDHTLDAAALVDTMRLSARAGLRMTLLKLELPEWDAQQRRDRLIGVSLTGWEDMVESVGLDKEEEGMLLFHLHEVVQVAARKYAKELGIDEPLLATTVKPEGTLRCLPTVSSGLHYSHSPYYIRRVRINAHDPLAKVAMVLGWPVLPEVGQDWGNANTLVIEFPVKSGAKRTKYEVSAIEQLENYKRFMRKYVDHNASITVTVKEDEWEKVEEWVWNNWDYIVGITFLSLDNNVYPLAPYEAITEEEYLKRKLEMRPFDAERLRKYETGMFDIDSEDSECTSGACPIR